MADAAVSFMIQNFAQFALDNAKLVLTADINVNTLVAELNQLKAFLRDASDKRIQSEAVKEMVKSIRKAIYAAEDAIDSYMIKAGVHKARHFLGKVWNTGPHVLKLHNMASQINDLLVEVKGIYQDKHIGLEALERKDSGLEAIEQYVD